MQIDRCDYPRLRDFLAGTYHQDVDESLPTYAAIADVELAGYDTDSVERVGLDVAALLAAPISDADLESWLLRLVDVRIEVDGFTPRTFLAMIGERARARLARSADRT